jgi:signal transduction histidine kinase
MGGDVTVASVYGKGTTFTIVLPSEVQLPDGEDEDSSEIVQAVTVGNGN